MCLVCREGHETLQHFLLDCISPKQAADLVLNQIRQLCSDNEINMLDTNMIQLIVDTSKYDFIPQELRTDIELLARRLCKIFMLKNTRNCHLYQKEKGQGRINFVISPVDGGRSTPGQLGCR